MFPLHKLRQLPRHQRLRKSIKIITEIEKALHIDARELPNLLELFALWAQDGEFSPAAKNEVHIADQELKVALTDPVRSPGTEFIPVPRRPLNTLRHILIRETGQTTADWDCIDPQGVLDGTRRTVFRELSYIWRIFGLPLTWVPFLGAPNLLEWRACTFRPSARIPCIPVRFGRPWVAKPSSPGNDVPWKNCLDRFSR